MRQSTLVLVAALALLLVADVLAFHDLFEPHSFRDWLMLAGTVLVAVGLAGRITEPSDATARRG
jgi:protein-S-isoprenylcysteine O-methyltransferase Ste14